MDTFLSQYDQLVCIFRATGPLCLHLLFEIEKYWNWNLTALKWFLKIYLFKTLHILHFNIYFNCLAFNSLKGWNLISFGSSYRCSLLCLQPPHPLVARRGCCFPLHSHQLRLCVLEWRPDALQPLHQHQWISSSPVISRRWTFESPPHGEWRILIGWWVSAGDIDWRSQRQQFEEQWEAVGFWFTQ